jgi:hypothetical protein
LATDAECHDLPILAHDCLYMSINKISAIHTPEMSEDRPTESEISV